jgi:Arc/MetJ family transcription regulator
VATILKLDDRLLDETVKLGRFKSKQQAVNWVLADYVHRRQQLRMLELAGKGGGEANPDQKRVRRSCE